MIYPGVKTKWMPHTVWRPQ